MNIKLILFSLFLFTSCNLIDQDVVLESLDINLVLVNGVLTWNEKPFTGKLIERFSLQGVKSEIMYVEGKKHGYEKHWFENGDLAMERYYANGFKTGVHKAYWEDGIPKFKYHFNDKGEFHGSVKEWYKTGNAFMSFNYINGKEEGSQKLWKMDSNIKANYEVIHGERFGLIGLKKCYNVTVGSDEVE
jgi:antitoxin component YwqK of YwqJK toxin-antitoxin module